MIYSDSIYVARMKGVGAIGLKARSFHRKCLFLDIPLLRSDPRKNNERM